MGHPITTRRRIVRDRWFWLDRAGLLLALVMIGKSLGFLWGLWGEHVALVKEVHASQAEAREIRLQLHSVMEGLSRTQKDQHAFDEAFASLQCDQLDLTTQLRMLEEKVAQTSASASTGTQPESPSLDPIVRAVCGLTGMLPFSAAHRADDPCYPPPGAIPF